MKMRVRTRRVAATGLFGVVAALMGQMGPAAAVHGAGGSQATGLIAVASTGETSVQLRVDCPPPAATAGNAGAGSVTVTGVSAACTAGGATVSGASATAANATFGAFSATCSSTGPSTGSVTVINGGIPAGTYTTFQSYTDPATGAQVHINETSGPVGGLVTRTAIQLHASNGAVTSIGQVVCTSVYPLAVDVAAPATGAAAAPPAIGAGSSGRPSNFALLAGGIAALLVAQGGFALWVRRRRAGVAGG